MKHPKFSVVIPAHNEADYIAKTLNSLSQVRCSSGLEIIVVDNNSSDDTAQIARKHGAKVVVESNSGVCWARQAGTQAALGEIIISTDADTTFSKNWIESIDAAFGTNEDIVAVAGPCEYQNAPSWGKPYTQALFGFVNLVYKLTGKTIYASATNIAFRKSAWTGYNTTLTQGGDELDLLRNLRSKGIVSFDSENLTYTSSRRLNRGFLYNVVVSFFLYYIIEYNLSRRFGRPVLGHAPAFRDNQSAKVFGYIQVAIICLLVSLTFLYRKHVYNAVADHTDILQDVYIINTR